MGYMKHFIMTTKTLIFIVLFFSCQTRAENLELMHEPTPRVSDNGAIIAITGLDYGTSDLFVTATANGQQLHFLFWRVNANNRLEQIGGSFQNFEIKDIALASLRGRRFIAAARDKDDRLLIFHREISEDFRILDAPPPNIGPRVSEVSLDTRISSSGRQNALVSARTMDGKLVVISYEIYPTGIILQRDKIEYGKAKAISMSNSDGRQGPSRGHGTAMVDSTSKLRYIHFFLNGNQILRGDSVTQSAVEPGSIVIDASIDVDPAVGPFGEWFTFFVDRGPSAVKVPQPERHFVGHGRAKLIGWVHEDSNGLNQLARIRKKREFLLKGHAAIAEKVNILTLEGRMLITAHFGFSSWNRILKRRRGKPQLRLNLWDLSADDNEFVKIESDHIGGRFKSLATAKVADDTSGLLKARFVVMLGTKAGQRDSYRLLLWRANRARQ